MAKRKRGKTESIATLIAKAYPGRQPHKLSQQRAFAWWSKSVSSRILKNARPVGLKNGVLTIHTSTTAWANSLQYECEGFLEAIRTHAPEAEIKTIVFRVGALPDLPRRPRKKPIRTIAKPLMELPDDLARGLAKIPDDNLRETVGRAASMALALDGSSSKKKKS